MKWLSRVRTASLRATGWDVEELPIPTEAVERMVRKRLKTEGLRVRRLLGPMGPSFEVFEDHWWFRRWCTGRLELSTPRPGATRLSWKAIPHGRPSLEAVVVTTAAPILLCLLALPLLATLPMLSASIMIAALLAFSPTVVFVLSSGGAGFARRRHRDFIRKLRDIAQDTARAAWDHEASAGAVALTEGEGAGGHLALSAGDEEEDR